jgi:uncharacterized protein (DUF2336 family)
LALALAQNPSAPLDFVLEIANQRRNVLGSIAVRSDLNAKAIGFILEHGSDEDLTILAQNHSIGTDTNVLEKLALRSARHRSECRQVSFGLR